jgi:aminocarboxymuconate-semialdehyde decarboxylase
VTYDVHAHIVPAAVRDRLRRDRSYGVEILEEVPRCVRIAERVEAGPLLPALHDVDQRLTAMDAAGVDVQILSCWIDLTAYALPRATGRRYARMFNEALAEVADAHDDRFMALATVPLQDPSAAADELSHAVAHMGMAGVEIATTVDGVELDDAGLEPFWRTAEQLRCIVLIHPCAALAGRNVKRYFLSNLIGNPAESSIAVAHLIFGGVLERHPDLRVCVVHAGGFLPYQMGRLDRGFEAKRDLTGAHLTRPPSHWLRRLYFDTVVHAPAALGYLVDLVGADHVVLGSDYPFEMGDPQPVKTVAAIPGLDDDQRRLILSGNVEGFLKEIRR